jgi:hypothetical protein
MRAGAKPLTVAANGYIFRAAGSGVTSSESTSLPLATRLATPQRQPLDPTPFVTPMLNSIWTLSAELTSPHGLLPIRLKTAECAIAATELPFNVTVTNQSQWLDHNAIAEPPDGCFRTLWPAPPDSFPPPHARSPPTGSPWANGSELWADQMTSRRSGLIKQAGVRS